MSVIKKSVIHGVTSVLLFGLPIILMSNAPWLNLTIGGVLNAMYHSIVFWSKGSED